MAISSLMINITLSSILFVLLLTPALSDVLPSTPVSPIAACNATTDPAFCKTVLPPQSQPQNLYSYSRFSLAKSLSNAQRFLNIINNYLARPSSLSQAAIRALEDCQLLAGLNIDFLSSAGATLNSSSNSALLDPQTADLQTLLSALITNQQTCLDGVNAAASSWSIKNGLSVPLGNGTKLYSVSLSLFTRAWVKKRSGGNNHHGRKLMTLFDERSGRLPLKMSGPDRELFEQRTGRKLLQSSSSSVSVSTVVYVRQDGTGNFTNISDAIAVAPNKTEASDGYFLIHVSAGVYQEYVTIPKKRNYVMMIGEGINRTIITGDHNNIDGWTTFNSATFAVVGQGFVGMNMTIQNTAGAAKHQAVAVRNGADLSTFYQCSFEGYQDTLYTHSMRQFYRECDVYGTVDFIFGNAAVVFQNCNIYSRLPLKEQTNTITAQGRTDPNQNTGTSIHNCNILAAPELAADVNGSTVTYLGRPWKQYSRTVIMQSFLDGLIASAGWAPWNASDFALSTLYYAEYSNTGPGSDTSGRVSWGGYQRGISAADALNFTVTRFVGGDNWISQTGIPFASGLL